MTAVFKKTLWLLICHQIINKIHFAWHSRLPSAEHLYSSRSRILQSRQKRSLGFLDFPHPFSPSHLFPCRFFWLEFSQLYTVEMQFCFHLHFSYLLITTFINIVVTHTYVLLPRQHYKYINLLLFIYSFIRSFPRYLVPMCQALC